MLSNDAAVVAYEADSFDPESQTGWRVVITGRAHIITDPDQITRYEQLLQPWVNHADSVLAIEPQIVTGLPSSPPRPTAIDRRQPAACFVMRGRGYWDR